MKKSAILTKYLIDNMGKLEKDITGGQWPNLPDFELNALDYLNFAEAELERETVESLINCISNLKRAMDCQIDTFLHICNLYDLFQKRNLKIGTKLEFLKEIGVFSSRSLDRFNTIRNKMEHYYEIPKIDDIVIYYDLVSALVSILQSSVQVFCLNSNPCFVLRGDDGKVTCRFEMEYIIDDKKVIAKWENSSCSEQLEVCTKEIKEFAYFFKVLMLLSQRDYYISDRYIINQLDKDLIA